MVFSELLSALRGYNTSGFCYRYDFGQNQFIHLFVVTVTTLSEDGGAFYILDLIFPFSNNKKLTKRHLSSSNRKHTDTSTILRTKWKLACSNTISKILLLFPPDIFERTV